jgi:hypothetical protein
MGAVSTQLIPSSKPRRSVAIDSSSSWAPHACHQPAPPMAQAPMPTRVMRIPVRPSSTVLKPVVVMDVNANIARAHRGKIAARRPGAVYVPPSLAAARCASTRCSTR